MGTSNTTSGRNPETPAEPTPSSGMAATVLSGPAWPMRKADQRKAGKTGQKAAWRDQSDLPGSTQTAF
ncbi:MAG: hypothetical protein A2W31_07770 [Planctomycetes bacterium RBG_16_64_10]|nr:MAG: hypothetical protein A2W31_07770 [Planctomycetes bacterium RBG_16_64_10]